MLDQKKFCPFLSMLKNLFYNLFFIALVILSSSTAKADSPFRNHRFDSFKVLDKCNEGDIVFIGNSITNMMNWNEVFGNRENIRNRGTSGCFTHDILRNLPSMVAGNPSKVFLMIGTNDLGTKGENNQPSPVAFRIKEILSRIREIAPCATVYYQSILPSNAGIRTETKIIETNRLVEEWINRQNDDKLFYIDLYIPFSGENGIVSHSSVPDDITVSFDGLHLTQKGYQIWWDIIKDKVGYESVIDERAINYSGGVKGSNGMRTTYFGALPVSSEDILIFGDEMIHSGEWHELLHSADFKDRGIGWGYPGLSMTQLKSVVEPSLKGNEENGITKNLPKAICIYTGTADLKMGTDTDRLNNDLKEIIGDLKRLSPSTPVFIMTLCPAAKTDTTLNNRIESFNDRIRSLVNAEDNLFIIDIHKATVNENGLRREGYFSGRDENYLSGLGYVAVANEIARVINDRLNTNYRPVSFNEAGKNIHFSDSLSNELDGSVVIFDNANSSVPYRIPAIAVNRNGDIIAVTDYRYSKADIGMVKNGKLDLRYRIKNSVTDEWEEEKTLAAAFGEGDDNISFGDPCIVADRESDYILVTSCSGNVSFPRGTHENHQGLARFISEDGGKTWSEYEETGDQILSLLDKRSDGQINAFFIGSGKITQSSKVKTGDFYRIYCAALVRVNDGKTKVNYVFYSDDFGKTWNLLGDIEDCPVPYGADEPKTEELPDGSILISSRIAGGRYYNIFKYSDIPTGKGIWDKMAVSNSDVDGIAASTNACNGETLLIPVFRNSDGAESFLLLQSVPANQNGKRANVGINFKELKTPEDYSSPEAVARNWDGLYEVTQKTSAYSTMVLDKDNEICFFFEENGHNNGYDMVYRKIPIELLTSGRYSYRNEKPDKDI
ncbi:MAG: exo-alpha-sialidase [Muribaculaceae bacterium]|nr:exo-alpha-sialidase [Muribaculaceae bacterium]